MRRDVGTLGIVLILSLFGTGGVGAGAPVACPTGPQWAAVIEVHLARYPGMQVRDLYKLLHQGALGSEHAVPNPDAARAWMDDELASLGTGPLEPVVDTIAPDGSHVRVHLRPFMERGGDPDVLLSAFVDTANGETGSMEALACAVETSLTLGREGRLHWDEEELIRYVDDWREQGYPSVHHSRAFEVRYRPAYRVVAGELVAEVLASLR